MKLDVFRERETSRSILGRFQIEGRDVFFSLEPARSTPVHPGHPCIPCGVFEVQLTMSPHFGYVTPELLAVPGRSNIRIHKGNKPEDSLGCTLVGMSFGPPADWISQSGPAFDELMQICQSAKQRGDRIAIEYHEISQEQTPESTT